MEITKTSLSKLISSIKFPSLTEKSINLYGKRQYTFLVERHLTKSDIKVAIENIFNVTVTAINTCIVPIKTKRVGKSIGKKTSYKKAFITLKEGQIITELFN